MFGSLAGLFSGKLSPNDDLSKAANSGVASAPVDDDTVNNFMQQERDDSPFKYGNGLRQYCLVEMRHHSEKGKHIETFVTCALADKATNIPRDLIQKACLAGGGLVRDRYFRFVDEKGQRLSNDVLQSLQKQSHQASDVDAASGPKQAATTDRSKHEAGGAKTVSMASSKGSSDTVRTPTELRQADKTSDEGSPDLSTTTAKKKMPASFIRRLPHPTVLTTIVDKKSDVNNEGMVPSAKGSSDAATTLEVDTGMDAEDDHRKKPYQRTVPATDLDVERTGDGDGKRRKPIYGEMLPKKRPRVEDSLTDNRQPTGRKKIRNGKQSSGDKLEERFEDAVEEEVSGSTNEKIISQSSEMRAHRPRSDVSPVGPVTQKKIRARNIREGWERTFDSIAEAAIATNAKESQIKQACLDSGGTVGLIFFCFATERHDELINKQFLSAKSAASKDGGPILPYTFDVSTLSPVKRNNAYNLVKPLKVIELVDKGAREVVCCFRGVTRACRALNIERSFVNMACANYGTPSEPDLGVYILRYAPHQNGPLAAYDYGAHKDDYHYIVETHQERLARWQRAMNGEKGRDAKRKTSAKKKRVSEKKKETAKAKVMPGIDRCEQQTEPITIGEAAAGDFVNLDDVSVPESITNYTDTAMICIICQEKAANVVFEPCHHCVVCSRCSKKSCRIFCPHCRTTILARQQPSSIRVVQPRIYNSYSFM